MHLPDPHLTEAYTAALHNNVLAALRDEPYFGFSSVCVDGLGHVANGTYPGLDWQQGIEALLWVGREREVRSSWQYVRSFLRDDGRLPFAIMPSQAGMRAWGCLDIAANGGAYSHWVPGDPFRCLANVSFIVAADAIYRHCQDAAWLREQMAALQIATGYLLRHINAEGLVHGGGFYLERPARLEFDGVNACYVAHAQRLAAALARVHDANEKASITGDIIPAAPRELEGPWQIGEPAKFAALCEEGAARIATGFQKHFWLGDRCAEYIHPQRGAIASHGLTDVDWAALAVGGLLSTEQEDILWEQLKDNDDFLYDDMPCGICTRPEAYEKWELLNNDRHDLAAMGRVWLLQAWTQYRRGDAAGLMRGLGLVAAKGRAHNWRWHERYYSAKTGDLARTKIDAYREWADILVAIVHRFVLGEQFGLDGELTLAPCVPASWWQAGFGNTLEWQGRGLTYQFGDNSLSGTYYGEELTINVRTPAGRTVSRHLSYSTENVEFRCEL